jgi:YD repeat-containing protein
VTLSSTYDTYGNRASLRDNLSSAGATSFAYDGMTRMTTITTSYGGTAGPQVALGYDMAGNMTSLSRTIAGSGTAVNTSLAYDAANRLTSITNQTGGGTALDAQSYAYDAANRVSNSKGSLLIPGALCGVWVLLISPNVAPPLSDPFSQAC